MPIYGRGKKTTKGLSSRPSSVDGVLRRVFVDADVLVSRTTRDWLFMLRLHTAGMFQLHTTPDVLYETLAAWRDLHPDADGRKVPQLEAHLRKMVDEVLLDFPGDVKFGGRDSGDRHVKAAADHCRADILLSGNVADFGDPDELSYDLYTPDEFFCLVDDSAPHAVLAVTRQQNEYWNGRRVEGETVRRLGQALRLAGCEEFADRVHAHLITLCGPGSIN